MTTIGTLAYQITANTDGFTKGARLTRMESSNLRKALKALETPTEKHQKQQDELAKLYQKGRLSTEQYRRALDMLEREFRQVNRTQTTATRKTQQHIGTLDKMAILMTGVNQTLGVFSKGWDVAARTIDMFLESAKSIDDLAKKAEKLDVTTESLVGLRLAASEMAGVGSAQFDMALQRMTRRLAEAANGTGEAKAVIEQLGLNAEELAKDPRKAIFAIADALQSVGTQSERLRIAFKLFDSEGAALVSMLGQGSAAIRDYEREAESLFATFSSEEAKSVERMNDQLGRLNLAFEGLKQQAVLTFAEDIATEIEVLLGVVKEMPDALANMTTEMQIMAATVGPMMQAWEVIPTELQGLLPVYIEQTQALRDAIREQTKLDKELRELQERRAIEAELEHFDTSPSKPTGPSSIERGLIDLIEGGLFDYEPEKDTILDDYLSGKTGRDNPAMSFHDDPRGKPNSFDHPLGPSAIIRGSQEDHEFRLRARGFGKQDEKKTQHQQTVEEKLEQIVEGVKTEVIIERPGLLDGADLNGVA